MYRVGTARSPFLLSSSRCGTGYQRKFSFQLNPPQVMSDPVIYSNVSSLITSMMGHTTDFLQKPSFQIRITNFTNRQEWPKISYHTMIYKIMFLNIYHSANILFEKKYRFLYKVCQQKNQFVMYQTFNHLDCSLCCLFNMPIWNANLILRFKLSWPNKKLLR